MVYYCERLQYKYLSEYCDYRNVCSRPTSKIHLQAILCRQSVVSVIRFFGGPSTETKPGPITPEPQTLLTKNTQNIK